MPDVLVIGGGIIGAACASEFSRRGADVTLVERDELAAHASGRNQGLWILPEDEATVAMARLSLDRYLQVAADAPLDVQLDPEPIGQILLARDDAERVTARTAVDLAEREGIRADRLDAPALAQAEPAITGEVADAWLVHSGHRLDPGALTVALALDARARGATVRHHLHARALARRDDRVVGAVTDDGVIEADTTVVAGGPWSSKLLDPVGVWLPVTGARGWLVRLSAPPIPIGHLVRAEPPVGDRQGLAPDRPKVSEIVQDGMPASAVATVLLPHRDGSLLVGASRQVWLTPEPDEALVVPRMLAEAVRLAPSLRDTDVLSTWWGVRPLSPDERPFVGLVADGLAVATGHGSEGVILGAGTAALLAAQLAGEDPPFDPEPFAPLRYA
jgi:glycine/D-amino acid oxidase-like deaminating enzyme